MPIPSNNYYIIKNNYSAISDPTINNDISDGYGVGSIWINVASIPRKIFLLVDSTQTSAIWKNMDINLTLDLIDSDDVFPTSKTVKDYVDVLASYFDLKTDKVDVDLAPSGKVATFDSEGNLAISDKSITDINSSDSTADLDLKADKVADTPDPSGRVATFDSEGNLAISDKSIEDINSSDSTSTLDLKADKVADTPDPSGKVATFDSDGNLAVSNKEIIDIKLAEEIFVTESRSLTAAECDGSVISNYGMTDADCLIDLPVAGEKLSLICALATVRAKYFRLRCKPGESNRINIQNEDGWVVGDLNGYVGVASGYTANDMISIISMKVANGTYEWFAMPIVGNWILG